MINTYKIIILLGFFLIGSSPIIAAEALDKNTITVRGEAIVELAPDFVEIRFQIIEESNSSERAMERVNQRTNDVIEVLEGYSIEDEDISMTGIVLTRKYEFDRNNNQNLIGFEVSRDITLKLRTFNTYELLASELIRADIGQLSRIESGVDNEDELKKTALENAARDARIRAEAIAAGLQVSLGVPIVVGENQLRPLANFQQGVARGRALEEVVMTASMRGFQDAEIPPFFVPAKIQVSATVWVMFELLTD